MRVPLNIPNRDARIEADREYREALVDDLRFAVEFLSQLADLTEHKGDSLGWDEAIAATLSMLPMANNTGVMTKRAAAERLRGILLKSGWGMERAMD